MGFLEVPWPRWLHSIFLEGPPSPGSISSVTQTRPAHAGCLLQPQSWGNAASLHVHQPGEGTQGALAMAVLC